MKVWTGNAFAFAGHAMQDTVLLGSYGGGTYILEGDKYEESVQYHWMNNVVGQKIKFILTLKDDTLTQIPVGEDWRSGAGRYSIEKYERIK